MPKFLLAVIAGICISIGLGYVLSAMWIAKRPQETRETLYNLALFAAMLAGIVANYFWVHGLTGRIDLNQLWRPVLISPIVFMSVYVTATKQPRGLIPILVAFQNGFFWQTIIEGARPVTAG